MNIRRKTMHRLMILFAALAVTAGVIGAMYVASRNRDAVAVRKLHDTAMEAYRGGDFPKAVGLLVDYLARIEGQETDAEATLAYAKSRVEVPQAEDRHILEAIQTLKKYLESIKPGDSEAQHLLLKLYVKRGYYAESVRLADELLAKNASDVEVLEQKVIALNSQHSSDEALATSRKLNDVAPLDLHGQLVTVFLMVQAKTPPEKVVAHAEALQRAHSSDPRFDVVLAYACHETGRDEEMRKWLKSAAGRTPPDAAFVVELSRRLDAAGMYEEADAFVLRAADVLPDAVVQRVLAQSLWEDRKIAELSARLKDLDPSNPQSDSALLGYRALALLSEDNIAAAKPILEALSRRTDGPAAGWSIALQARYAVPPLAPALLVQRLGEAISRNPENPVLHMMLGVTCSTSGESGLAIQRFIEAAQLAPGWATPYVMIAREQLATGRHLDAAANAREGVIRAPTFYETQTTLAKAQFACAVDTGRTADFAATLPRLREIQRAFHDEDTLPIYVTALSRSGDRAAAVAAVNAALASEKPLPADALTRLANAADAEKLDLGAAIRDHARKLYGLTPDIAMSQAVALLRSDKGDAGLKLMLEGAKGHESDLSWRLAIARYRDLSQDEGALKDWIALGDQYPADSRVQQEILRVPSGMRDRDFWARTVDRLKALTGEQGLLWRIERSQWLLTGDSSEKDRAEAVNLLTQVTRSAPGLAEPHHLLAQAMQKVKNIPGALAELRAAADARPGDPVITDELVHLLMANNRAKEAMAYLDKLAQNPDLSVAARHWLARQYAGQGMDDKAIALLKDEKVTEPAALERDAMLAGLYRRSGRAEDAAAAYAGLIDKPIQLPNFWSEAADFFAARHDLPTAEKCMARLADLPLKGGLANVMQGQFAERWKTPRDALAFYQSATKAAPNSEAPWIALAQFHFRRQEFDRAAAVAADGLKATGGSVILSSLQMHGETLKSLGDLRDMRTLIDVLAAHPQELGEIDMLAALAAAKKDHLSNVQTAVKLKEVADRYPHDMALQTQVVESELHAGQTDLALAAARQAADANPESSEPQRLLAILLLQTRDWAGAERASLLWRQHAGEQVIAADLTLAEVYLRQPRIDPAGAIRVLQPHVSSNPAPGQQSATVKLFARALIVSGRAEEAGNLLKPLTATSADWRKTWLDLTSVQPTADAAAAWLDQLTPTLSPGSSEQTALGRAWYDVGSRFDSSTAFQSADKVLQPLLADSHENVEAWLTAAMVAQAQGDFSSAETRYRSVLKAAPDSPDAANDLAYLLWLKGNREDLTEARKLSESSIASHPNVASYYDTLARIQASVGDAPAAIQTFRLSLQKDSLSVEAMIGLADLLSRQPETRAESQQLLTQLKTLLAVHPHLPPVLRKQYEAVSSRQ